MHRIEIERTGWHANGAWYRVSHDGRVLVEKTRAPEVAACGALAAIGLTGTAATYFPGGTVPRMFCDIAKLAPLWKPEPVMSEDQLATNRAILTAGRAALAVKRAAIAA